MAKNVINEMIIILLLCLAIILLLGILLYEYVPITRAIPNTVSYTTPEKVKKELATIEGVDESKIIMTYEVDSTDLNNYRNIQDYKPGKANPFSSYEATGTNTPSDTGEEGGQNNTTNSDTASSATRNEVQQNTTIQNNNTTQDNNTSSGGHFFQNKGTK